MKMLSIRCIAEFLLGRAVTFARPAQSQWAAAMAAELRHIKSDWEAFCFAWGCVETIIMEMMSMTKYENLMRLALALLVAGWAGAKIMLLVQLSSSDGGLASWSLYLWATVVASALFYAGAAISLFQKRFLGFCAFLILALASNSVQFGFTNLQWISGGFANMDVLSWRLGLISEEYFAWTAFLAGAGVLAVFLKPGRARDIFQR